MEGDRLKPVLIVLVVVLSGFVVMLYLKNSEAKNQIEQHELYSAELQHQHMDSLEKYHAILKEKELVDQEVIRLEKHNKDLVKDKASVADELTKAQERQRVLQANSEKAEQQVREFKQRLEVHQKNSSPPAALATKPVTTSQGGSAISAHHDDAPEADLLPVWMSGKEIDLVKSYIVGKGVTYFEWGSGGSTFHYARLSKVAYSIEHNKEWCSQVENKMKTHPSMRHIKYFCVPVEQGYKGWAGGFTEGTYAQFHQYVDVIDAIPEITHNSLDVVLVDGRARLQCALKVLPFLKDSSIVLIHDFWHRHYYHDVLKYYDEIGAVRDGQSLVALKRKPLTEIRSLCKEKFNSDWPPYKI